MADKRDCLVCRKNVRVKRDGSLYAHGCYTEPKPEIKGENSVGNRAEELVPPAATEPTTAADQKEAEDFLTADQEAPEPATVTGQPEPRRDRWGRYVLKDPRTGQFLPRKNGFTRATTFAKALSNTYGIAQWQQRNVAIGLAKRADLLAQAIGKDVRKDRDALNKICDDAREAAGEKISASAGTAVHHLTELYDAGHLATVDAGAYTKYIQAYALKMDQAGLKVVPELIERSVLCTMFGENVAGTLDRVVKCPDGKYRIADLKTGRDPLEYGDREIGVQLLLYAEGMNQFGVYDWNADKWDENVPKIETDYAIVIHLPLEGDLAGRCGLYQVDFKQELYAWARMCADQRKGSGSKAVKFSRPYDPAEAVSCGPSWDELFAQASSRQELSELYTRVYKTLDPMEVQRLVAIGRQRLAALEG